MTKETKTITRKCSDCGYKQEIRQDKRRKQTNKWRCGSCNATNKLKLSLIPIIAMFVIAIGASAAYAEQDVVVTLPLDRPFETDGLKCQTQSNGLLCNHPWFWSISPEGMKLIPPVPTTKNQTDYEVWFDEVIPIVEANPYIEPKSDDKITPDGKSSITDGTTDELVETVEDPIDAILKCLGGQEQLSAFQPEYTREGITREPDETIKRLLQRYVDDRDKFNEECISIEEVLQPYANKAYPGLITKEDTSPKETVIGLKMSAGAQVTEEKLEDVRKNIKRPSWHPDPYGEFTGINRGSSEPKITEDGIVNVPDNELTGMTSKQILDRYHSERAASLITAQDIKDFNRDLRTKVCEIAWQTSGFGGLSTSKWRTFLFEEDVKPNCHDLLGEVMFRGELRTLEEIIDLKLEQEKTENKQDLRTHK